jgi:2-(1,2-epoxy-1,2-dihydrophenyl)acetyl-CoA isomerase
MIGYACRPRKCANRVPDGTWSAENEEKPMTDSVLYDADNAVAHITLNRPGSRNALTAEMKEELLDALLRASSSAPVRAVILTGAGPGFCGGQDLREHAAALEAGVVPLETVRAHYNPIITAITTMPNPVIAAVNGVAAGAGAAIALACDFRIAAQSAKLVLAAFAMVGLGPDSGASWTLQRLVGAARATELLMLPDPVAADRALALGLVNEVVPDDDLGAAAAALAARLAAGPTVAYAAIKEALLFAAAHSLPESLEKEAELQWTLGRTADHRAATLAFTRKQPPTFEGR